MNFLVQEPFVLFLYEFQPETFHASIEKIHPRNFPALKQRIIPDLNLLLFSESFSTPSSFTWLTDY